ncbi:hypothetical protein P9112_004090 [Eukaryota sp. TZLM1-RC]
MSEFVPSTPVLHERKLPRRPSLIGDVVESTSPANFDHHTLSDHHLWSAPVVRALKRPVQLAAEKRQEASSPGAPPCLSVPVLSRKTAFLTIDVVNKPSKEALVLPKYPR